MLTCEDMFHVKQASSPLDDVSVSVEADSVCRAVMLQSCSGCARRIIYDGCVWATVACVPGCIGLIA